MGTNCFLTPSPCVYVASAGEVCFYLKKTREQFRVKGRLQVVDVGESDEVLAKARRHQWKQISPASQASFATSLIPGLEAPAGGENNTGSGGDSDSETGTSKRGRSTRQRGKASTKDGADAEGGGGPCEEPVSDEFCLVLLWPHFVDHLRLGDKQTRNVHKIKGDRDGGGTLLSGTAAARAEEGKGGGVPEAPVAWVTMAVNP